MDHHSIINDMAICIVVAWILALGAQFLRQPLILAYMVAGLAVGPVGFRLVTDLQSVQTISEMGLILLLFMIGLEIDLKKMLSAGSLITLTSTVQIVGGCALGVMLFIGLGFRLEAGRIDALYLAVAAALSSTVIIVKILYDKRELDTLPGRITLGVLVLQDLFAILFLALQPNLKHPSLEVLGISVGKVLVMMAVAFAASRYALPPLFRAVARLPELVLVGALAWCFLMTGLADHLGLSREMGALIAGVAISTFPYTLDVAAKVTSLRDFFVTLFFVALGMTIPLPDMDLLGYSLLLAAFVVGSRFLTVTPLLYCMKQGHRASILPAIHLAQVSELSLVILTLGVKSGDIHSNTRDIVAYTFVFMAVVSSYAMTETSRILKFISPRLNRWGFRDLDEETMMQAKPAKAPRIFLLGFSWTASSLLEEVERRQPEILRELAVIDFNPQVNQELRKRGLTIFYGDITHRDTLLHAGVPEAEILVCTLPNTVLKGTTNLRLLQQLRGLNPEAKIIMHAELFEDVAKLYAAGANYVSVPRLVEARELCEVIEAARNHLMDEKRAEVDRELKERHEVIP